MFMLSIYKKELNSMNFIISGKNIEVTPGLKEAIEQKLVRFWKKPLKQPLKRDCNFLLVRNRNSIFSGQTTLANLP